MTQLKPNIVYIVADQWRGDCLGLYGNAHPVMTPHLNQLAAEGVNFLGPMRIARFVCRNASPC
jgi:arylsulfatase A-like enzyme